MLIYDAQILKTIPWDKVDIQSLTVEWKHIPEEDLALLSYMQAHDYVLSDEARFYFGPDLIFVKKSLIEKPKNLLSDIF